ncbi:MAG: hypothetical protein ABIP48_26180, partial [Planctomycetota bacterium]
MIERRNSLVHFRFPEYTPSPSSFNEDHAATIEDDLNYQRDTGVFFSFMVMKKFGFKFLLPDPAQQQK